jgi:hypothetical protein
MGQCHDRRRAYHGSVGVWFEGSGEVLKAPRVGFEDRELGVCCPNVYCVDCDFGQGEEASADE